MTTEPGTTDRTGQPGEATDRQAPAGQGAQYHRHMAEQLLALWQTGEGGHVIALENLAAAAVHAELAKLPDPKVREAIRQFNVFNAAERFDMLEAAQRVRRLTAERRAARDAEPPRSVPDGTALEQARWDLVGLGMGALEPDDLAAFEAAVRADQREKDAVIAEASFDDELPGYSGDMPGDVCAFAAQRIRNSGGAT